MPEENVEIARQVMEALGRRDAERLIALSDPEVEWHSFFALGEAKGVYRGYDGTRRYMNDLAMPGRSGVPMWTTLLKLARSRFSSVASTTAAGAAGLNRSPQQDGCSDSATGS